jgi:hypothetical protein
MRSGAFRRGSNAGAHPDGGPEDRSSLRVRSEVASWPRQDSASEPSCIILDAALEAVDGPGATARTLIIATMRPGTWSQHGRGGEAVSFRGPCKK